jgi:hypothetical protein
MSTTSTIRELAHRSADGIDVRLWWDSVADLLTVRVFDRKAGTRFVVPAPRDSALEVFNHPFAHAAIVR